MSRLSITSDLAATADPEILSWDTEFWGRTIGRAYTPDVNKWAADNLVNTVCLLVPADDPAAIQDAEERGFRFMDVRVTLERYTTSKCKASGQEPRSPYRHFIPEQLEDLIRIARESHRITRFYADPHFPDERCDDLYEAWIRNSVDGWAQKVLVVARVITTKDRWEVADAVGYCTLHVDGDTGSIGLIAVGKDERGQGIGMDLVNGAISECALSGAPKITVVTQGRNIAAQRVFQRCGFITKSTELWFHKQWQH